MKIKYYIFLAFLSIILLAIPNSGYAQDEKLITIESVVNDEEGNPVANAEIFSGNSYARTDAMGKFSISAETGAKIIIEAKGFENQSLSIDEVRIMTKIGLKKASYLYEKSD